MPETVPAARPALPALRKLTRHESRRLRRAAKAAAEQITLAGPVGE